MSQWTTGTNLASAARSAARWCASPDSGAAHQGDVTRRNRAAVAEELRRLLPRLEGLRSTKPLPFGLAAIDSHLPEGGLPCGALHEIVPEDSIAAAFGFVVALLGRFCAGVDALTPLPDPPPYPPPQGGREKIIFVLPSYGRYGRLYGHGFNALGLDPARLILVETAHRKDALWAMEEALRSGAPAAVAGVIDKLELKLSQRLQLAATDAGVPLFLLRQAKMLEGSAAATRWRVAPAQAARDRFGLVTRSRWHLLLERCRNGRAGEWTVEYDHVAHRFSLAAALADPALPRGAKEKPEKAFGDTYRS